MTHTKTVNSGELQYKAIRELLQCGHVYATLERYEEAYTSATKNFMQAGTPDEEACWYLVCEAINAIAKILFDKKWTEVRRKAVAKL
jgi:hypothetical protein